MAGVGDTGHAGRKHVVDRRTLGVLLDVDNANVDLSRRGGVAAGVEVKVVGAPLAAYKLEATEAQVVCLLESGHKDTGEADGRKVGDVAYDLLILAQRHFELIPFDLGLGAVAHGHDRHLLVGDVVLTHHQVFGADRNTVLEIALVLVERVVLVDVLYIGHRARRLIQWIGGILGRKRVAFHAVVAFVTLKDAEALLVVVIAAVEVVIVTGRVVERREQVGLLGLDGLGDSLRVAQFFEIILICREYELLVVVQTVEAHVLSKARTGVVVKRVSERILLRHTTPHGFGQILVVAVVRNAVLVAFETVLEDILADFAEVDIEVAAFVVGVLGIEEGVHKPELHILDIRLLEVGVVHSAHDTAPATFGIEQGAVIAYIRRYQGYTGRVRRGNTKY